MTVASDKDVLFTDPYMLYKHTKHPAEAFAFIKFLTSKPAMESYVREVTFTPSNPDYLGLWYKQVSARTGLTQEQLQTLIIGARAHGFESPNHLIVNFSQIVNTAKQDTDPIFLGIDNPQSGIWQDDTREGRNLRVWQNHGLQLDRVPDGFTLLATSYLCKNQMMVRRSDDQLIYTVQFHLEKSFEDWNKSRTRWEHPNESRDGRILFENFLRLALASAAKRAFESHRQRW